MKKEAKLHIIIIMIGAIILIMSAFHTNIEQDQLYTIDVNELSVKEAIEVLSEDVHPIGYYMLLRIFTTLFGKSVISCRIFSVIPIIILGIVRIYTYQKRFWRKDRKNFFILRILFTDYDCGS